MGQVAGLVPETVEQWVLIVVLERHWSILTVGVLKWLYFYGSRVRVLLPPLMLEPLDGS